MDHRTLDSLIATKVMGWTDGGDRWEVEHTNTKHHTMPKMYWQPSKSIQDAWQVIDKVRGLPGFAMLDLEVIVPGGGVLWAARFVMSDGAHYGDGDTASVAICLAALSAIGHPVQGRKV